MEWRHFTRAQYITTAWSGGTTTQLAIAPEGAVYADRKFLWRLSSAQVELEHSDFTPLPDYDRLISVLKGELELKIGQGERGALEACTVRGFDGGVPVESWGRCVDFNLMLRKGACQGFVQPIVLPAGGSCQWAAPVPAPQKYPNRTLALYCAEGDLTLSDAGVQAAAGELLLCERVDASFLHLESKAGTAIMAAVIYTR